MTRKWWWGDKPGLLLATNIKGIEGTSNVMRRTKGSATKTPELWPNIIKTNNASMGGIDVIDQKTATYKLDCKSKFRCCLRMFLHLIDIAIANSHIVYTKLGTSISLLDFKIIIAKSLTGRYSNWQLSFSLSRTSKRKALESSLPKEIPTHMPQFSFCKNEGSNHKKLVSCPTCGLYLCCTKERNCFPKHHI